MSINERLRSSGKLILDGGTGTEIQRLGGKMSAAWGAVANIETPEVVIKVHENHIKAGCDIVTTNTFATCRHTLDGAGISDQTIQINRHQRRKFRIIGRFFKKSVGKFIFGLADKY